jgi:hypothetical protein
LALLTSIVAPLLLFPKAIADAEKEIIVAPEPPKVLPEIPPIMVEIALCESKGRQFNEDGSVHMGELNPLDTGKWQINQYYHLEASKKLGMDIFTLEGNTAYALYLYKKEGTAPWTWSKWCWGEKVV